MHCTWPTENTELQLMFDCQHMIIPPHSATSIIDQDLLTNCASLQSHSYTSCCVDDHTVSQAADVIADVACVASVRFYHQDHLPHSVLSVPVSPSDISIVSFGIPLLRIQYALLLWREELVPLKLQQKGSVKSRML
jgi:hypothetical protein